MRFEHRRWGGTSRQPPGVACPTRCPSNDDATTKISDGGGCRSGTELEEGKEIIGGDRDDNEEVGRLRFVLFA